MIFYTFCLKIGTLLASFGNLFRSKKLKQILLIFGYGFDVNVDTPRPPSEAKTIENARSVVQNRRSTFLSPGHSKIDFGSQNL